MGNTVGLIIHLLRVPLAEDFSSHFCFNKQWLNKRLKLKGFVCVSLKRNSFLTSTPSMSLLYKETTTNLTLLYQPPLLYRAITVIILREWFNFLISSIQRMIRTMFPFSFPLVNSPACNLPFVQCSQLGPNNAPGRWRMKHLHMLQSNECFLTAVGCTSILNRLLACFLPALLKFAT